MPTVKDNGQTYEVAPNELYKFWAAHPNMEIAEDAVAANQENLPQEQDQGLEGWNQLNDWADQQLGNKPPKESSIEDWNALSQKVEKPQPKQEPQPAPKAEEKPQEQPTVEEQVSEQAEEQPQPTDEQEQTQLTSDIQGRYDYLTSQRDLNMENGHAETANAIQKQMDALVAQYPTLVSGQEPQEQEIETPQDVEQGNGIFADPEKAAEAIADINRRVAVFDAYTSGMVADTEERMANTAKAMASGGNTVAITSPFLPTQPLYTNITGNVYTSKLLADMDNANAKALMEGQAQAMNERASLEAELPKWREQLADKQKELETLERPSYSAAYLDEAPMLEGEIAQLQRQIEGAEARLGYIDEELATGNDPSVRGMVKRQQAIVDELQAKMATREEEFQNEMKERGASTTEWYNYTTLRDGDKQYAAYKLALDIAQKTLQALQDQAEREGGGEVGFWRAFGRTVTDPSLWDFGLSDLGDALVKLNIASGAFKTPEEQAAAEAVLQQTYYNQAVEQQFGANRNLREKGGEMTAEMLPYMLDFLISGGESALSRGAMRLGQRTALRAVGREAYRTILGKGAYRYLAEGGMSALGRELEFYIPKALGVAASDIVRAGQVTLGPRIVSNIGQVIENRVGDVEEQGGTLQFKNDKSWGRAAYNAFMDDFLESISEMSGRYFEPLFSGKSAATVARWLGAKNLSQQLVWADAGTLGDIMRQTQRMFHKVELSGLPEEIAEEYVGQALKSMIGLDTAYYYDDNGVRRNLFTSGDFHAEIWSGMAMSMGLMEVMRHGINEARYRAVKNGLDMCDATAQEMLKDRWADLKEQIDNTKNEDAGAFFQRLWKMSGLSEEQMIAVSDYMTTLLAMRGMNLGQERRKAIRQEIGEDIANAAGEQRANQNYQMGYSITDGGQRNGIRNIMTAAMQQVNELLGVTEDGTVIGNGVIAEIDAALDDPAELERIIAAHTEWGEREQSAVRNYIDAKQTYDGMIQRSRDDIDIGIARQNAEIDSYTNKTTGKIQGATMKDDRKVYIIDGVVVPFDDRTGIDTQRSDGSVMVMDRNTGKVEMVSAADILITDDQDIDPEDMKQQVEDNLRASMSDEAANQINGVVSFAEGATHVVIGENGEPEVVTIVPNADGVIDNGDGTVNVTSDGGQTIRAMSKQYIQQQSQQQGTIRAGRAIAWSSGAAPQERVQEQRPQVTATPEEEGRYGLNKQIRLRDEDGNEVIGRINSRNDVQHNYQYEVEIDGRIVPMSEEELDAAYIGEVAEEEVAEGSAERAATEEAVEGNEREAGTDEILAEEEGAAQTATEETAAQEGAPQSALEQIPVDEQGNPVYEQSTPATAWDALVEQTEGDENEAQAVADDMVKDKEEALKQAQKEQKKPTQGATPAEKIAERKARADAVAQAQSELDFWNAVANEQQRRAEEQAQQQAQETQQEPTQAQEAPQAQSKRKGERQIARAMEQAQEAAEKGDMMGLANAVNNFDSNVRNGAEATEEERATMDAYRQQLADAGYEVVDMMYQPYDEGLRTEADFVSDDSLPDGVQVITSVRQPQVNKDGKMVQSSKIVVTQGTAKGAQERADLKKRADVAQQKQARGEALTRQEQLDIAAQKQIEAKDRAEQRQQGESRGSVEESTTNSEVSTNQEQEATPQQTEAQRRQEEARQVRMQAARELQQRINHLAADLRQWIDGLGLNVPVQIARTQQELLDIAAAIDAQEGTNYARRMRQNLRNGIVGNAFVTRDGTVVMYAPALYNGVEGALSPEARAQRAMERAQEVFAHEAIAHRGLQDLLGVDGFNQLCDDIYKGMSRWAKDRFVAYQWNINMSDSQKEALVGKEFASRRWQSLSVAQRRAVWANKDAAERLRRGAADEYAAHLAEKVMGNATLTEKEQSIWEKIVSAIKKLFGQMDDTAIADALVQARDNLRRGEQAQREIPAEGESRMSAEAQANEDLFSRAERIAREYEQAQQEAASSRSRVEEILEDVQGQKQADVSYDIPEADLEDIRFSITNRQREQMENTLRRIRPDMTDDQRRALLDYLDGLNERGVNNATLAQATFNWFVNGAIKIPEDMPKVRQAVKVAKMAKVDPTNIKEFARPQALIDQFTQFKVKDNPINPDTVPTLTNKKDYGNGITVYDVAEDWTDAQWDGEDMYNLAESNEESRKNMRRIIDTHWGENANPWCLLQADENGELTEDSATYWNRYHRYGKKVAFKDGKLLAFFAAGEEDSPTWWDRQDVPHDGIPITREIPNDEQHRSATYEYVIPLSDIYDDKSADIGVLEEELDELGDEQQAQERGAEGEWSWYSGEYDRLAGWHEGYKEGWSGPKNVHRGNQQNGVYEVWDKGEALIERSNYKEGKLDGLQETWYHDGVLSSRENYKEGMRDGLYELWDNNGTLIRRDNYKDDKRDGLCEQWWGNGNLQNRGKYKDGKSDGTQERYDINGELERRDIYDNNKLKEEDHYNKGQLLWRRTYTDDQGAGVREEFWSNGQMRERTEYSKQWTLGGLQEQWNRDGVLVERSHWKEGNPDGIYEEWYDDGRIKSRELYKDGKKVEDLPLDDDMQNENLRFSVNEEGAAGIVAQMEEKAEIAPVLELTKENWEKEFGKDNTVSTPLGIVKMGENQYAKLIRNKREGELGMTKPTLENPDVIVEKQAPSEGAERDTKYLFIKTFIKANGDRIVHYESVTVRQDGMEVSISSHEIDPNIVKKEIQNGVILHLNDKISLSSEGYLTEAPNRERPDLVPTSDISESKGSENSENRQENLQGNGEFNTPQGENILEREGNGELSDDELSAENDAVSKAVGYNVRTARQRKAMATRLRREMRNTAEKMAERLHLTDVDILDNGSGLTGALARSKGFYNQRTGKITIIIGNNSSLPDVVKTVLHEAVAHHGLRQMFGTYFDEFLDNVYKDATEDIRHDIAELVARNDWNFRKATEEYLASLAERMDEDFIVDENGGFPSWWTKVKRWFYDMLNRAMGGDFSHDIELTDNELRYILWSSYDNLRNPNRSSDVFSQAEDIAMRDKLGISNYNDNAEASIDEQVADADDILMREGEARFSAEQERQEAPQNEDLFARAERIARDYEAEREEDMRLSADYERMEVADWYERLMSSGRYQSIEAFMDSMLSLKKVMEKIAPLKKGQHVEDIAGFENPYLGENRLSSVNEAELNAVRQLLVDPLIQAVHRLTGGQMSNYETLVNYMMAKHGLERNRYMAERDAQADYDEYQKTHPTGTKTLQDFIDERRLKDYAGLTALTGTDNVYDAEAAAEQMVDDYEGSHSSAAIKDLWDRVRALNAMTLSKQYESGFLTRANYDHIRGMYQYYIPLRGFDEETAEEEYAYIGHPSGVMNTSIQKAWGRKSKADDPIAVMQAMAEGAVLSGNRNMLVKQRFMNFVMNHPSDLVSVSELWLEKNSNGEWVPVLPPQNPDEMEQWQQDMEQKALNEPDKYAKASDTMRIPYRVLQKKDLQQHQVIVRRGGRDYILTVNGNPRLAQAINGETSPDNPNKEGWSMALLDSFGAINRALSGIYTTMNPDFIVSNFCRDMIYSNSMVWVKEKPKYARRFNKNIMRANPMTIKILFAKLRNGRLNMDNELDRLFYEFITNGGETGYARRADTEEIKRKFEKNMRALNEKLPATEIRNLAATVIGEVGRSVELCARFAAFITSREEGRDIDRSVYDGKEISVNFNKKGSGDKFFGAKGQTRIGNVSAFTSGMGRALFLFWNASLQGTFGNFLKNIARHPSKGAILVASYLALGMARAYLGAIGGSPDGDDDEMPDSYFNFSQYTRRSNLLIKGTGKAWIKIPLSIEYRAIYGLGEMWGSALFRGEKITTNDYMEQVCQLLPLDMTEGRNEHTKDWTEDLANWLKPLIPAVLKPAVEVAFNYNYMGRPIYRDKSEYNQWVPAWMRVYPTTNQTIVNFCKWMNELGNGDSVDKGSGIDINPAGVEYLLRSYVPFYTFVNEIMNTIDVARGKKDYNPMYIPLLNRVEAYSNDRTGNSAVTGEYYELKTEIERTQSKYNGYRKKAALGDQEMENKLYGLVQTPEFARYALVDPYIDAVSTLGTRIRQAEDYLSNNEKGLTEAQKQEVETLKQNIAEAKAQRSAYMEQAIWINKQIKTMDDYYKFCAMCQLRNEENKQNNITTPIDMTTIDIHNNDNPMLTSDEFTELVEQLKEEDKERNKNINK